MLNLRIQQVTTDHSHFLKKFLKKALHFSECWLFLKKWNNESVLIKYIINITPLYIFNSTNRGLSYHKCKKKFCYHNILVYFQIVMGGVGWVGGRVEAETMWNQITLIFSKRFHISVSILCKFAMLPDVYILLSPQREEVPSSSWGNRCLHRCWHIWPHIHQKY